MKFYLGTHMPSWLTKTPVPLFISAVRLRGRKRFPRALGSWALDSGGFSEISKHGTWTVSAADYAEEAMLWDEEIGNLDWCAIQDWMCEPEILRKTGSTVREHQERTVRSYLDLMTIAPDMPWVPVVQGWSLGEYEDCVELYMQHGVDLTELPIVGVGSVCRRQSSIRGSMILCQLATAGLNVHAFGLKRTGLAALAQLTGLGGRREDSAGFQGIASADSMAWSFHARREKNGMQNSLPFALEWRAETLAKIGISRCARSLDDC